MNLKKIRLIISIDTECDKGPNWLVKQPLSFTNIFEIGFFLEAIQKISNTSKLTLLLSPEVLKNGNSVQILKSFQNVELGTHMHLEFLMSEEQNVLHTEMVQAELTQEQDFFYLEKLTALFIEKIGYAPTSFRAGRFGYNKVSTFSALQKLGYLVDSSVVPGLKFAFKEGIEVDNSLFKLYPFKIETGILEAPISIVNTGNQALYRLILKVPSYRLRKLFQKYKPTYKWIRPTFTSPSELKSNTIALVNNWNVKSHGDPIINIMFHSNELYPNTSPYFQTWEEVNEFKTKIMEYLEWLTTRYDLNWKNLSEIDA